MTSYVTPFVLFWLICVSTVYAQVFDERFDDWPIDLKIMGTVALSDAASISRDHLQSCFNKPNDKVLAVVATTPLPAAVLQCFEETFKQTLQMTFAQVGDLPAADIVAFYSDDSTSAKTEPLSLESKDSIQELLNEGKTLLVIGPLRSQFGKNFIPNIRQLPWIPSIGVNAIFDCLLVTDFIDREFNREQLQVTLATLPRHVGIGVEPKTTLILQGRRFHVVGEGQAHFFLAKSDHLPARTFSIAEQVSRKQSPTEWQVDLTEWRRDAIERTLPPFPPPEVQRPYVENGTLMIVGGGVLPKGLMRRFVELAGGMENAKLVYIPCLEEEIVTDKKAIIQTWKDMGVRHTALVHTKDRLVANSDEEFLAPLREASGIWFGGGRQWNFADSYYATTAHRLMKEVLHRGGVIGGSSAGASIQARYLARATPIENFQIMAPGYERGGLGFIDGVAIDQHFSQRNRQADMERLVNRYPQLLGIGIDESTGLIVQKSIAQVVGEGRTFFYDHRANLANGKHNDVALSDGEKYDLALRFSGN